MSTSTEPTPIGEGVRREVGCELTFDVAEDALVALQIAPATSAGTIIEERIDFADGWRTSGSPRLVEIAGERDGRVHLMRADAGMVSVNYFAALHASTGSAASTTWPVLPPERSDPLERLDAIVALRQSRYCPSDALSGFAVVEFDGAAGAAAEEVALRVASWVFERLAYVPGSSGPLDTALDTLLSGSGVCRDFAQLAITLCRALGVPARLASVYAPGLSPMDFHAVVEVLTKTGWQVFDPTRLAPRSALVRIATGRDAADTAFATTLRGQAELVASTVFASSDGDLPADDHAQAIPLA